MNARIWERGDFRLLLVGLVFMIAWGGIGYRLFELQGSRALAHAEIGFDQRIKTRTIEPSRGTIFDREGIELAMTIDGFNVVVDPTLIVDIPRAVALLAPFSPKAHEDLLAELVEGQANDRRFAEIVMRVDAEQKAIIKAAVEEARIKGVYFRDQPLRVYPADTLAAQTIGLTRFDDSSGIEGLEKTFDTELRGRAGRIIVEVDPRGRAIPQGEVRIEASVAGSDIVTTIDREIQFAAEQALRRSIQTSNAIAGAVVVMLPDTGEIVAMASWPDLDLNDRSQVAPAALRNRVVADVFEPGSTLKTLVIAAALEEGVVTAKTPIDTPKSVTIGDFEYEDHGQNPEWMSVEDVLSRSSNVGTIKIQRRLGDEKHYEYLSAFGLGRPSGLDVAGERHGTLDPTAVWTLTSGSSISIGYAVGATALQLAAAYATIANNGVWLEPYLVREIITPDGDRISTNPRSRRVLSPETAAEMRRMLYRVIVDDSGTGSRAQMLDFTAGGKTGTTKKFDVEAGMYSEDTIASFIGMAPIDDPRVVVVVILDTPSGEDSDGADLAFGGVSAAPVFAEIAQSALHQLGVPPDRG